MIQHLKRVCWLVLVLAAVSTASAQDVRQSVVELINRARQQAGKPPLRGNDKLDQAAQGHADWMARTGKMVHVQGERPRGNDRETWRRSTWHPINRAVRAGYLDLEILSRPNANNHIGENVAHGNPDSGPGRFSPQVIVNGWMNSPGHRAAILGDYQDIGVGMKTTDRGDVFWCTVFGKPASR